MSNGERKYYGKYRGVVANNVDPLQIGRIQVSVPNIAIIPATWAMPCFPIAGKQMGVYVIPQVGSGVWVEFENGDLNYPIWTGCWWGSVAEVPPIALAGVPTSPNIVLQTTGQHSIVISDLPGPTGGIMLKSASGAVIIVNDVGITISNGKGATIMMNGPEVLINNGALLVK